MASIESVHQLLATAAKLLDQAASEIRDAKVEPVSENIKHVARALVEIFEIDERIYGVRPDLKPAYLSDAAPVSEANGLLTKYMCAALELEVAGRIDEAIWKFREFLAIESSPLHRKIAESEIARLSAG